MVEGLPRLVFFHFPDTCPRYCDVSLLVLAGSPLTRRGKEEVVRLQVTLHREYTEGGCYSGVLYQSPQPKAFQ